MRHCPRCADERWVCEAHTDRPWGGAHGCPCGAAGKPCPICNKVEAGAVPDMPDGFVVDAAADFDPDIDAESDESLEESLIRLDDIAGRQRRQH